MTTLETVSPRLFLMPCFTTPTSRKIFSIKAFRFSVQYYHKTGDGTFCVRGENMYGDNFKNQENTKISFNPRALAGCDSDDPARAGHRQRFNGATSFQTWKQHLAQRILFFALLETISRSTLKTNHILFFNSSCLTRIQCHAAASGC